MSKAGAFILERPAVVLTAIISVAIIVGQLGPWLLANMLANDFSVYWRAANGPLSSVYSPDFRFPFSSAPTMLIWISPLAAVPMWPAYLVWTCVSVAAIAWACKPYLEREELWFLMASPPVTICLFTGQIAILLTAMMLWSFGTSKRLGAGICLGVIATIKPQLVLFVPLLLLLRCDWRAFVGSAATFTIFVALTIVLYGPDVWSDWMMSMEHFRTFLHREGVISGAISPAAVAEFWGLPTLPFLLGGIVVGGWLVYRYRRSGPIELVATTAIASLLASPYGMNYDLVAVAPFLILAIFRGSIVSVVPISSALPSLALVLASFELVRSVDKSSSPERLPDQSETGLPAGG